MWWCRKKRVHRIEPIVFFKLWRYNHRWATNGYKRIIWKRINKTKEKMMMIAFTIGFGTYKLASDHKDCDVANIVRCLRINAGSTAQRNNIGSCVRILCDNCWKILRWYRIVGRKTLQKSQRNSSDRFVDGKHWSISLTVTAERNVKNLMSTLQFTRSETNVILPEESKNWRPGGFQHYKKRCGLNPRCVPPNQWEVRNTMLLSPSNG